MKRYLAILAVALSVGGCAGTSVFKGGLDPFVSVQQPITPAILNDVQEGLKVATAGLLTYRRLCIAEKIDQSCRGVIVKIQGYTRPAQRALVRLRAFVRQNDQVNAIAVFNELRGLVADINTARAVAGVN